MPEVSNEIGSVRLAVRPSVCPLSVRFLGIVSLVFCEFWYGVRNAYEVVYDRASFSGNVLFVSKIGKMDQKWGKNSFWICWKIWSLIITEFIL